MKNLLESYNSNILIAIVCIVAVFLLINIVLMVFARRIYKMHLANMSISKLQESRYNLMGVQLEKEQEVNKFLYQLLFDLVSGKDDEIKYKAANLRVILTIMDLDREQDRAFRYIRDVLQYPSSDALIKHLTTVLSRYEGKDVLTEETNSAYDALIDRVKVLDMEEQDAKDVVEETKAEVMKHTIDVKKDMMEKVDAIIDEMEDSDTPSNYYVENTDVIKVDQNTSVEVTTKVEDDRTA